MALSSRRARRASRAGTLRLALVLLALVGVNVYFLGLRGGTSIGALLHTTRVRSGTTPDAASMAKPGPKLVPLPEDPIGAHLVEGQLGDGQTIAQALTARVGKRVAAQLETTLSEKLDLGSIRAGQPYALVYDAEDKLVAFEFRAAPALAYRVELSGRHPILTTIEGRADTRTVDLTLPTGPAMWEALRRAGESAALGERLGEVFADEGELCGAYAPSGERVRLVAEKRMIGGRLQRYGRIVGAEWVTRAGARRAFYFAGAQPGYYTERGEAVERSHRATPFRIVRGLVPGQRTSRGLDDGRLVVEHGAPTGTGAAIACAVAAGTVIGLTRAPAGATLTVQGDEGERITYTRITRLVRGMALGQKLTHGAAIGRADGGLSLTYEGEAAAREGRALAPRRTALTVTERPRFGEQIAPVLEKLRNLALKPTDPLAVRALSAIP